MEECNLRELTAMMETSAVTPDNTAGEHPRFSKYKNVKRAEELQQKRRQEFLQHQKDAKFNYSNHARKLAMNLFDEEDDDMDIENNGNVVAAMRTQRKRNRYADELMLSEWLVDIPETLSSDWIFLPCPVGRRCLVVASNGVTSAYAKSGYLLTQFSSYLPGGSRSSRSTVFVRRCLTSQSANQFTLLDCVFSKSSKTFYCLDLIAWKGQSVADTDFECRIFLMNSRLSENANYGERSKEFPYRFVCLPYCKCEKIFMEEMMQRDFEFEMDGVLFYYAYVHYHRGQSPLVGWLKPWMLPEILSVSVPRRLRKENAVIGTSKEFIDKFNVEHKHLSQIKADP